MSGPLSLADWAGQIWNTAKAGDGDKVFAMLEMLPENHELSAVKELRKDIDLENEHLASAESQRLERLTEVWGELDEHLAEEDLSKALGAAVEIHSLSEDKESVLANAKVAGLVDKAQDAARLASDEGRWLDAQDLLFRLNLLYDRDQRYKKELHRISTRLMMIRLYAPERLHDMRNALRLREDRDPLPPFNAIGEDWKSKLEGIDDPNIVVRAINHSQIAQVDGADMADLLLGSLEYLRTLATTSDLATAFPKLGNDALRAEFLSGIDRLSEKLSTRKGIADAYDLTHTLRKTLEINDATVQIELPVILHEFGNGAMARLDDFSSIIWPDELRNFQKTTRGRFTGVGIQIQLDDGQRLKVVTPLEGTPAHRAGILPGDIITQVGDESTIGITLSGAVERITGEKGSTVTLTIERQGVDDPLVFPLKREDIPIYSVKGWKRNGEHEKDWDWFIDPENHIGYVRLSQFSDGMTREFDRAVSQMKGKGLDGLIVDLRFNPGGLLTEAVELANRFVSKGVIVSQHDADGQAREVQRARRSSTSIVDMPVVVLINGGSASASEIVAGALQDHGKAVLVGTRSFGKGSVQNVYDIGRGAAALRLTIQYYRLPNGRLIHRRPGKSEWGIEPDIMVEMPPSKIGEAIRIRQDADVLLINNQTEPADGEAKEPVDPRILLTDGVDTQLGTALLLVQSQVIAKKNGLAMITPTNKTALRAN